jgi:hypothetical protein
MHWQALSMLAVIALPAAAQAGFKTGTDVLNFCTDTSPLKRSICLGYLQGIADGLQIRDIGVARICIPDNLQGQQLIDIAVELLRTSAEPTGEAVVYIGPAFATRWSCRSNK